MKIYFIIGISVLIFILIIFIFAPIIKRKINYTFHKKNVGRKLYSLAKDNDTYLIQNFEIKSAEKSITFDHLYFGKKYIYCIKDIVYPLGIEGNAQDVKWFNYQKNKEIVTIMNPFKENEINISSLARILKVNNPCDYFISIICINNDCSNSITNCTNNQKIVSLKNLNKEIKNIEKRKDIKKLNQKMLDHTVQALYKKVTQVNN